MTGYQFFKIHQPDRALFSFTILLIGTLMSHSFQSNFMSASSLDEFGKEEPKHPKYTFFIRNRFIRNLVLGPQEFKKLLELRQYL